MRANDIKRRNNVTVTGTGDRWVVLAHGFGCDQTMWRFFTPYLRDHFRLVCLDYVGSGRSDVTAFSVERYGSLEGYAQDIVEVCDALDISDATLIGHSVGAMTGLIAAISAPQRIGKLVMVCPSPCFLNDPPEYHGGFEREDLEDLLGLMDQNYIGWANHLAPLVMGSDGGPMVAELAGSFCSTDPLFARTFAKATFFSDCRPLLGRAKQPTLILQSSRDALAAVAVGRYVQSRMSHAELEEIEAEGHCLHMTHPARIAPVVERFIAK